MTSQEFRKRLTEKERRKYIAVDEIRERVLKRHLENQRLEPPITIPAQYIPLLLERCGKRSRGRPKQTRQSPEQAVDDRCAYHAVQRLLAKGWSRTKAGEAVGQLMNLSRQAVLDGYNRVRAKTRKIKYPI
jgi:hypothetical protein